MGSGLGMLALTLGASGRSAGVDWALAGAKTVAASRARDRRQKTKEERKGREGCAKDAEESSTADRLDQKGGCGNRGQLRWRNLGVVSGVLMGGTICAGAVCG